MTPAKKANNIAATALVAASLCAALFYIAGCAGKENKQTAPRPRSSSTIQRDVMMKISRRVLGDVPARGQYGDILKRGVIRVALPPSQPPYAMKDPVLGMPDGLFPALISEMSGIMNVKNNMEFLSEEQYAKVSSGAMADKYDLYVSRGPDAKCAAQKEIKVFYTGGSGKWMSLCVSGGDGDEEFIHALKDILTYLNETGVFARIYSRYAQKT